MANQTPPTLLRKHEVLKRTGLSASTIWRLEHSDQFPQRLNIGPNAVAWVEAEIADWITARIADRGPVVIQGNSK